MATATKPATAKPALPKTRLYTAEERAEGLAYLLKHCPPGATVYTILRKVSSSGMSRRISMYVIGTYAKGKPELVWLDGMAGRVLDIPRAPMGKEGLRVNGCGMDMGYHLVYSLSRRLYPDGFKLAKGQHGRNGDTSGHDNDGGYALRHRWL